MVEIALLVDKLRMTVEPQAAGRNVEPVTIRPAHSVDQEKIVSGVVLNVIRKVSCRFVRRSAAIG